MTMAAWQRQKLTTLFSIPYIFLALSILPSTFRRKSNSPSSIFIQAEPQNGNGKNDTLLIPSNHTRNVAVLLSSSTFYHNYRHTTNTLAMYQALKRHGGFTDDNIILMLADEVACNARNPFKNSIFPTGSGASSNNGVGTSRRGKGRKGNNDGKINRRGPVNLFENVQVDYSGSDVTVDNFFRVLLGRHPKHTPSYQRLDLDPRSSSSSLHLDSNTNVFIYVTGHGGDGFFKFRDVEDFTTTDFRGVLEQMQVMKRFKNILFLTDTCQAFTLAPDDSDGGGGGSSIDLKNVYTVASSLKGENSYAHHGDISVGHSVIDRYVYYFMEYMGGFQTLSGDLADPDLSHDTIDGEGMWEQLHNLSVKHTMVNSMYTSNKRPKLGANIGWSDSICERRMDQVPLSDFFVMKQGKSTHTGGDNVQLLHGEVDFW